MDKLKRFIKNNPLKAVGLLILVCGVLVVIGNFAMNAQNSGVLQ